MGSIGFVFLLELGPVAFGDSPRPAARDRHPDQKGVARVPDVAAGQRNPFVTNLEDRNNSTSSGRCQDFLEAPDVG
jgi:hypothetical protein